MAAILLLIFFTVIFFIAINILCNFSEAIFISLCDKSLCKKNMINEYTHAQKVFYLPFCFGFQTYVTLYKLVVSYSLNRLSILLILKLEPNFRQSYLSENKIV